MSLISSRVNLRHRCTIERDANVGAQSNGWKETPDWQEHLVDVPCLLWTTAGREQVVDGTLPAADGTSLAIVENIRLFMTLDNDVTEKDRIASISERGTVIAAGPIQVRAVLRRRGHLEIVAVRVH